MHELLGVLERQSRSWTWLLTILLSLAFGWLNQLIGWEVSFSVLYLIPIGIAAWILGRWPALGLAIGCTVLWWNANRNFPAFNELILYWNAFVRFLFFAIVTELLVGLRQALERERELARVDPLTGLANTRAFTEIAQREIATARRTGRPLAILWIDLDGFKKINDELGHAAGDDLLAQIGGALRRSTRRTDFAARMGGDEFAVLLPETNLEGAEVMVRKITENVSEHAQVGDRSVTLSVGGIACEQTLPDLDTILHQADALMYEVKRAGRGAARVESCTSLERRPPAERPH